MSAPTTEQAPGRAGRNLPVAIVVGLSLGGLVLLTLYLFKPAFLVVIVLAILVGLWELVTSLREKNLTAPLIRTAARAIAILILAYTDGREAMTVAMVLTFVPVAVWHAAQG